MLLLALISWIATAAAAAFNIRNSSAVVKHLRSRHPQVWEVWNSQMLEFGPLPRFILFGWSPTYSTEVHGDSDIRKLVHNARISAVVFVIGMVCSLLLTATLSAPNQGPRPPTIVD
jgi:hypothetical protein